MRSEIKILSLSILAGAGLWGLLTVAEFLADGGAVAEHLWPISAWERYLRFVAAGVCAVMTAGAGVVGLCRSSDDAAACGNEAGDEEDDLRVSRKRHRSLFNSLSEGFALHEVICDDEGKPCDYKYLEVNPAFERLTGVRREQIIGKTALEMLPEIEPRWIEAYGEVALSGESIRFEQFSKPLGRYFSVIAYSPVRGQFATLVVDVTDRRRSEQRIGKLNAVLRSIRQVNQLVTQVTDQRELLQKVCQSLAASADYHGVWVALRQPSGRLVTAGWAGADVAPADGRDWPPCLNQAIGASEPGAVEVSVGVCETCPLAADVSACDAMCAPLRHGGRKFGVLVAAVDRSLVADEEHRELFKEVAADTALALYKIEAERQRREAGEELIRSERLLRLVMDESFDGISFTRFDQASGGRQLVLCNDRYVEMSGRTWEQLKEAENLDEFAVRVEGLEAFGEPRRSDGPCRGAASWLRPDGEENYFEWISTAVSFEGDEYAVSIDRDITARVRAERALRTERDKAQHYMDVAGVIFVALDADGVVKLINKMGCDVLGVDEARVLGRNWYDTFIPAERRTEAKAEFERILAGDSPVAVRREGDILTASGERRVIAWHNSLTRDASGAITGTFSSGQDITEQRRTEEQLRQAQKMEAIGRLAGGVAHDFNNQLTVIQGYCDLLLRQGIDDDMTRQCVQEIRQASRRAATMTGQLLIYSRKQVLRPDVISVNRLLNEMAGPLSRMIGEDIRLDMQLAPSVPHILADPTQLQQAIMNIAVNARDAMPDGGALTIRTEGVELTEQFAAEHFDASPGSHLMLELRDTGEGMSEKTLEHLFEPFFTTKPTGKGTGLGLAMVYGFVKQSNGCIHVTSRPDAGSRFRVYLPATTQDEVAAAATVLPTSLPAGEGVVLVAEDEKGVRDFIEQVLTRCGYAVLAAADAAEAAALAEVHSESVDLLVADVVMPGRSGVQLAEALREKKPDLKVLYITGYTDTDVGGQGLSRSDGRLLRKPFGPDRLAEVVRGVLAEEGVEDEVFND